MPQTPQTSSPVEIDGSYCEGGGQILRTALTLSVLTGRPTRLRKVRIKRDKPGLSPQHLTVVRALAELCDADVEGASLRSTELTFIPSTAPRAGSYTFDVAEATAGGSAGSISLLFQALLFPLLAGGGVSHLTLKGGTHVRMSPTFDDLQHVYLPTLARMGVHARITLETWGFYPRGGGEIRAEIEGNPGANEVGMQPLWPLTITERGELESIHARAVACNLPDHIAHRMANRAEELLADLSVPVNISRETVQGVGPGAVIHLTANYVHVSAGFTGHGKPGKPSEAVAEDACKQLRTHHATGAPVEPHLADQLLLPMALAGERSEIRTSADTSHLVTNAHVIQQFLPVEFEGEGHEVRRWRCRT